MIDNKATGRMIAGLRQSMGLTQQQLAAIIGVSHQAVSKWESGLALPDIQTMAALTNVFGITFEQLIYPELHEEAQQKVTIEEEKELKHMTIQQLLMMAPFMSKEAVEEIAMTIETPITGNQLAKLAPHLRPEALQTLIEKHHIEFTWESLKKIAPFMPREIIDDMARKIASGEKTIGHETDYIDKAMNDLGKAMNSIGKDMGKAFDDIGRGVGKAFNKAVKFGGTVINDVADAFSDNDEKQVETEAQQRSARVLEIRKKAFERAMVDGKWDWIAEHLPEIENETALKAKIAETACKNGMSAWVCEHMGAYADPASIEHAIDEDNWAWLGECAWLFTVEMQQKTALAAMNKQNWQFLSDLSSQMELEGCALEIATAALDAGERALAAQLAGQQMAVRERNDLAQLAADRKDAAALGMLAALCEKDFIDHLTKNMALSGDWNCVEACLRAVSASCIENLMDIAVDQGNFEMLDQLDKLL